jgi:pilus assembly protein Flp/PilA
MKPLETRPRFRWRIDRFVRSEDGPTAVEYAVILAMIVIVCLSTISRLGTNANKVFKDVKKELKAGS